MMRLKKFVSLVAGAGVLCFLLLFPSYGWAQPSASDSICAEILEIQGAAESQVPGGRAKSLMPGMRVTIGEELSLKPESWIVLLMADSTIRKFSGPATMTVTAEFSKDQGSVLTRLSSAITGLFFAQEKESPEAAMVTRMMEEWPGDQKLNLPLLVHPAQGSSVVGRPAEFQWRKLEGVPLYRVSVYSWDRLMWQGTTSDSYIQCPAETCVFVPGERYYWGVEALIGNTSLRSKGAEFRILAEEVDSRLNQEFKRIDSSCSDPDLCNLIKVRLLLALNLYRDALELLDSPSGRIASQTETHRLRAEILGVMGLYEEAFREYRSASGR